MEEMTVCKRQMLSNNTSFIFLILGIEMKTFFIEKSARPEDSTITAENANFYHLKKVVFLREVKNFELIFFNPKIYFLRGTAFLHKQVSMILGVAQPYP